VKKIKQLYFTFFKLILFKDKMIKMLLRFTLILSIVFFSLSAIHGEARNLRVGVFSAAPLVMVNENRSVFCCT